MIVRTEVVLFCMLAGSPPFSGSDDTHILHAVKLALESQNCRLSLDAAVGSTPLRTWRFEPADAWQRVSGMGRRCWSCEHAGACRRGLFVCLTNRIYTLSPKNLYRDYFKAKYILFGYMDP